MLSFPGLADSNTSYGDQTQERELEDGVLPYV